MKTFLAPWLVLAGVSVAVVGVWNAGSPPEKVAEVQMGLDEEMARVSQFDLLVDYQDDAGADVLAATAFAEEPLSSYSDVDKLYRIRFDSYAAAKAARDELAKHPSVETIDWDVPASLPADLRAAPASPYPIVACGPGDVEGKAEGALATTAGFPDDPCFRYQWNLKQIGLPEAWKKGQGRGVVVAVIDTGVSPVPDLAGIEIVKGFNFVTNAVPANDDHGHGTHVAGTIAQATNNALGVAGVAFGAKIMPVKALSGEGIGTLGGVTQAIRFAADNGAHVINMSLGGPFPIFTIHNAVKYAKKKGVLVVAAAGNDGGRVGYPAAYNEVFAVGATRFDEGTTFYSNRGIKLDVAAPGGDLYVDQNKDGKPDGILQNTIVPNDIRRIEYLMFMGTSMASPHVSGVAALVIGAGVTQPDAVMNLLRATARAPRIAVSGAAPGDVKIADADTKRIDDKVGWGIVDANAALDRARGVKGAGGLGLGAALAGVGLLGLRKRGRLARLGAGFPAGLVIGAAGLFFLPLLVQVPPALSFLTVGLPEMIPATFSGFAQGNPLLWSALLPLGAIALLGGVPRLRGLVGGLAFGVAGALAVAALTGALDVRFMPDLLDRAWLAGHAALAAVLGRFSLRR